MKYSTEDDIQIGFRAHGEALHQIVAMPSGISPNPAMISTGVFDECNIRADIRQTLSIAGICRLEIIMKYVHTLNNESDRLARWVRIAREEIEKSN